MQTKEKDLLLTDVRSRAAILQVPVSLGANMSWDADGRATISNTGAESINMPSLVTASQPQIIVLSVHCDMLVVSLRQLLNSSFDVLHASRLTHCLGAVVGVATGTIPVTCKGFRVERNLDTPLFGTTDEEVASHPEMVAHGDAFTRTDLKLPLGWHNLCVDTADVDPCIEASAIVGFDEITGKNLAGTYTRRSKTVLSSVSMMATYRHRSSKGLGGLGIRLSANHREYRQHRTEYIPAQDRTTGYRPLPHP